MGKVVMQGIYKIQPLAIARCFIFYNTAGFEGFTVFKRKVNEHRKNGQYSNVKYAVSKFFHDFGF